MRILIVLSLLLLGQLWAASPSRLLVKMKVNGKDVVLGFDTGAERSTLFEATVRRLGLKWEKPPPDTKAPVGEVPLGITEECKITLGKTTVTGRFRVYRPTETVVLDVDGVLAWSDLNHDLIHINADALRAQPMKELPKDIQTWQKFSILPDHRVLTIKLKGKAKPVLIDTGSPNGIDLSGKHWEAFRNKHSKAPRTVHAYYAPGAGVVASEVFRAKKFEFGKLSFANIPVSSDPFGKDYKFSAIVGLDALTRVEILIDRKNLSLYMRPVQKSKSKYEYNRAAAVFIPKPDRELLFAKVIEKGPAHTAGVRDGDVLLKIGDLDTTKWRTDPKVLPLSRFWSQPAGTKLKLTLMRNYKEFVVTVELKEIFPRAKPKK